MEEVEKDNPITADVVISTVYKNDGFIFKNFIVSHPTQSVNFSIGLKIKNISSFPIENLHISDLKISKPEKNGVLEDPPESHVIGYLNPNEEKIIWWTKLNTFLSGQLWIECVIKSKNKIVSIQAYQQYKSGRTSICKKTNYWDDQIYIIPKFESEQSKNNKVVIILTILTALDGIIGLDVIFEWVRKILGSGILLLGKIIYGY